MKNLPPGYRLNNESWIRMRDHYIPHDAKHIIDYVDYKTGCKWSVYLRSDNKYVTLCESGSYAYEVWSLFAKIEYYTVFDRTNEVAMWYIENDGE